MDFKGLNQMNDENIKRIIEYMKTHERAWPQDISLALEIEFGEVMDITRQLVEENIIGFIEKEKEE